MLDADYNETIDFINTDEDTVGADEINIDEILGGSLFEHLLNQIRGGEEIDTTSNYSESISGGDDEELFIDEDANADELFINEDDEVAIQTQKIIEGAADELFINADDDEFLNNDDADNIDGGDKQEVLQTTRAAIIDFEPEEEPIVLIAESKISTEPDSDNLEKLIDNIDQFSVKLPVSEGESRPDNLINTESVVGGDFSNLAHSIVSKFLN
jgi:hypothetical protein